MTAPSNFWPLFPLGRVVGTHGAVDSIEDAGRDVREFLDRHAHADWGEVCAEDAAANDIALVEGTRVLSAYTLDTGVKIWIITEADRSSTTVLLPEDY